MLTACSGRAVWLFLFQPPIKPGRAFFPKRSHAFFGIGVMVRDCGLRGDLVQGLGKGRLGRIGGGVARLLALTWYLGRSRPLMDGTSIQNNSLNMRRIFKRITVKQDEVGIFPDIE